MGIEKTWNNHTRGKQKKAQKNNKNSSSSSSPQSSAGNLTHHTTPRTADINILPLNALSL